MLRSSGGPLRHVWRVGYSVLTWAWAAWLRGRDRRATVYAARGVGARSLMYGISDIDLAVVIPADPRHRGRARRRVLARQDRLTRAVPGVARTVLDRPVVLEREDLREASAAPALLAGRVPGSPASVFYGPDSTQDRIGLQENPGVRGPFAAWRRVGGPAEALPEVRLDRSRLRIAAWLELQAWWRRFLQACAAPAGPDAAYLCVKLVAEPARILMALGDDQDLGVSRRAVLERALRVLPEEEATIRWALALERDLTRAPDPPWAEALAGLVGLSGRVARALSEDVARAGTVSVVVDFSASEELAVGAWARDGLLPLADWRALVRGGLRWGGRVWNEPPDETLAPLEVRGLTLASVVTAVREGSHGPYPALRNGELLVLASRRWPRTQFRAVQCALTDPVSFALLDGVGSASFPDVPGWSALDTAARAVGEHRAWLAGPDIVGTSGDALSMLISAARATLFYGSVLAGSPVLTPTVAGTLRAMRAHWPEVALVVDEVLPAYASWRREGVEPPARVVSAFGSVIAGMRLLADPE
jgi:hypothetical protein